MYFPSRMFQVYKVLHPKAYMNEKLCSRLLSFSKYGRNQAILTSCSSGHINRSEFTKRSYCCIWA